MALVYATRLEKSDVKIETAKITSNIDVCEGGFDANKGNKKMHEEDHSSTQDELDELDEHLAYLPRKLF